MPALSYPTADFVAFTKISSADMNGKLTAIKTLLNTTKLDSDNVQLNGLSRDRLALGTANHVLINSGTGAISSEAQLASTRGGLGFNPTISAANAGKVVGVNDAGSSLELRTAEASVLISNLANNVATITAGEAITANDAVCLALNEGSYKVFKADADAGDRITNFLGFALNSASVTAQVSTIAISPAAWTSGTAQITVNGRLYSQAFTTDHNTSVDALAAKITADADVLTCAASGSPRNLLTITGEGALTLTITITANPTGATFGTPSTGTSPVGGGVRIHYLGPLAGFSGLTLGGLYYVSTTAGSVSQTLSSVFVGQALSTTTLFVNPNRLTLSFSQSLLFIVAGGFDGGSAVSASESFNFTSWSSTTNTLSADHSMSMGNNAYAAKLMRVGGSSAPTTATSFNKVAWATEASITTGVRNAGSAVLGSLLYVNKGSNSASAGTGETNIAYSFNNTTWTNVGSYSTSRMTCGSFTLNSVMSVLGGYSTTNVAQNNHDTYNGTSFSTATVSSNSGAHTISGLSPTGIATVGGFRSDSTATYSWNGSTWGSSIALTQSVYKSADDLPTQGAQNQGFNNSIAITAGGFNSSSVTNGVAQTFNGTSWTTTTSTINAYCSRIGGTF